MITQQPVTHLASERVLTVLVVGVASALAIVSARSSPTSWSDSSRLATVESLVDFGTLSIDRSIFQHTGDRIFVAGHYYSHKPAVPALVMAAVYQVLQGTTGLTAREQPDRFYAWNTIGSAGLSYVIAVWCVLQLGKDLRLPLAWRLGVTASFALATLALPYTRAVNDHILLLAVASAALMCLARFAAEPRVAAWRFRRPLVLGTLTGFGYAIETGAGLPLLISVLALVAFRARSVPAVLVLLGAALPWMALHHALNYSIGGTFVPVAMVPEYFQWPGSPQSDPSVLTGAWNHPSFAAFVIYTLGLLVGPHGFLLFNVPLWLAVAALVPLARRRPMELPEIVCATAWAAATWLVYGALSTNYSGWAVSIRWFVPLLIAGVYVLAVFVREYPTHRRDLLVLTAFGVVLTFVMWRRGPFTSPPSMKWVFVTGAAVSWALCRLPWDRAQLMAGRWSART